MKIASLMLLLLLAPACKEAEAKTKGEGDKLRPFIIKNCGTGERYCQVCAYGGKPKIMVVADLDDTKVEADLVRVQKIVEANEAKGLVAFALFGELDGGKFTPVKDDEAAAKKLKALTDKLKLTYPVTVVPSKYTPAEAKGYPAFVDAYEVRESRRIMLGDQGNAVLFAETISDANADQQFEKLEAVVAKL